MKLNTWADRLHEIVGCRCHRVSVYNSKYFIGTRFLKIYQKRGKARTNRQIERVSFSTQGL